MLTTYQQKVLEEINEEEISNQMLLESAGAKAKVGFYATKEGVNINVMSSVVGYRMSKFYRGISVQEAIVKFCKSAFETGTLKFIQHDQETDGISGSYFVK